MIASSLRSIGWRVVLLLLCAPLSAATLRDRLHSAHAGDYIVCEQSNHLLLLCVRELTPERLIVDEICAPAHLVDPKKSQWRDWVRVKAPGHTSWNTYEIDLARARLIEAYSVRLQRHLPLDDNDSLAQLLTLPLAQLPKEKQRRIGPQPAPDEEDRRALWVPQMIIEGKRVSKPEYCAFVATWPSDGSPLSSSEILLYFNASEPQFPFPFWIEIFNGHYAFRMHVLDSGRGLALPYSGAPPHRRSPTSSRAS